MRYHGWQDDSGITGVDIGRWEGDSEDASQCPILFIKLCGNYGTGKRGNASARILRMAVSAVTTWDYPDPGGLIIDISELDYSGGDSLFSWLTILEGRVSDDEHFPISFVCSENNSTPVQSLIEEYGETRISVFRNVEAAIRFLQTAAG